MSINPKIAFYDAKSYDQKSFSEVNADYNFSITYFPMHLNQDTVRLSNGYHAVCAFVNDSLDQSVINTLNENGVSIVALRSAGYNNVDLKAAYGKVHVVRVPAYSPYAVAEHAAALMLSLNRKTHKAYYRVRDGNFSINGFLGFDLYGKTAGIIGTGKIGRCLISILKGFGMKILAYDAFPDDVYAHEQGITYMDLQEVYSSSDVISLHCPLNQQTHHMINQKSMEQMKDSVMIINTGRGKLIDTKALINALKGGKIGSAGLDVYEEEAEYFFEDFSDSVIGDDVLARLLTFPNVLITSHQGFFTREALKNIATTTLDNIKEYFEDGFLKNEICYHCNNQCLKKQNKRCF